MTNDFSVYRIETVKTHIKEHAERIRKELCKPGIINTLYGEPLDINDPDSVLVAAVLKAEQDFYRKSLSRFDFSNE